MQQTIEAIHEAAARSYNVNSQYRSGLRARMREHANGNVRRLLPPVAVDADPAAQAFADGYRDGDDDSDEPRPGDDSAL